MKTDVENGYLLDTNAASMMFRAKSGDLDEKCQSVWRRAQEVNERGLLFICAATVGEIEYGLHVSNQPNQVMHTELRDFLQSFPIIYPMDRHVASECYSKLRAQLFKKYARKTVSGRIKDKWPEEITDPTNAKTLGIQENDLWIVAVAMTTDLIVVTADKMHRLRKIVGSKVIFENWAEHK